MIAHSGATIEAMGAAAWRAGGVGFNLMISAGNEPVTDMADYLDYLVDDPGTEVICLVLEKIRRPAARSSPLPPAPGRPGSPSWR